MKTDDRHALSLPTNCRALASTLIVALLTSSVASAAPCRNNCVAAANVLTVPAGFIAVPLAVPVALPSYVQYQAPLAQYVADVASTCQMLPQPAMADRRSSAPPRAAAVTSLIAAQCGGCHGGAKPKAELDLTGSLADMTRLKAIARLLTDEPARRMPPQKDLSPEVLGRLIQELSTTAEASAP